MFRHADIVFLSYVRPVVVLNAAFCMTCSLLMLVDDEMGNHVRGILQSQSHDYHECVLFSPCYCGECFYYV